MPKISSTNNTNIILKYFARVVISSALSIFILNSLFSFVLLEIDLSLEYSKYIALFVFCITALFTAFISTLGFKQNYMMLLSVISIIPLLLFSLVNTLVNKEDFKFFALKIILSVIISVAFAIIKSVKKHRS